ncbi:hypothetical protein ERJ75_001352300 [Trypanosoma vivax]|uniref:PUM-HD domain-containing protein n=1 Tax=Trypanosoma vivax (strain Y486) TaxID=1055687 RepID=G0UCX8_TRYVY|nr:hypothetical protein TRVL_09567 [Trypanosoma vivax]KAH8608342.1 hypothetical protein ERJ75_001352300 [Trypanosoma vivax]CCC53688.1 conserved hypothetical protein [Trypanosoma vivax Y486]
MQYFNQHGQPQQQAPQPYFSTYAQPHVMLATSTAQQPLLQSQSNFYSPQGLMQPITYINATQQVHNFQQPPQSTAQVSSLPYSGISWTGYRTYDIAYPATFHHTPQYAAYYPQQIPLVQNVPRTARVNSNRASVNELRDSFFAMHVKNYAVLEEASRRGSLRESIDKAVLARMGRRGTPGILRILVILDRQYVAACMSVPPSPDDIVLSKAIATEFLDVRCVYCDDGLRLVEVEDGTHVAKHVYVTVRTALEQLAIYQRSLVRKDYKWNFPGLDGTEFMKDIVTNPCVFSTLSAILRGENDDSFTALQLWRRLLLEPAPPDPASENGEEGQASFHCEHQQQIPKADSSAPPVLESCGAGIFATIQGSQLFRIGVSKPKLRQELLRLIAEVASPQGVPASEEVADAPLGTRCTVEQLFLGLFSCSLDTYFVFECFGCGEGKVRCDEEVDIICAGMERLALRIVCSNGGSFMMTAMVKMLCPTRFSASQRTGGKSAKEVDANLQHRVCNSNNGNNNNNNGNNNFLDCSSDVWGAQTSVTAAGGHVPGEPSYWRLFHAVARAFVDGAVPSDTGGEKVTLSRRVKLLTQHVVACRSIQCLVPFFVDCIVQNELDGAGQCMQQPPPKQSEEQALKAKAEQFYEDCKAILEEITRQCGILVNHSYGNYVLQTVIVELAHNSSSAPSLKAMLDKIFESLRTKIFEVSVQKFASNCVERAVEVCVSIENGSELILDFASAFLAEGPRRMLQVALHQYGNYVIHKVLERVTGVATGDMQATKAQMSEACQKEAQYMTIFTHNLAQLQQSSYSVGILSWMQKYTERTKQSPTS